MPQTALAIAPFAAPIVGGLISKAIAGKGPSGGGAAFQPLSLTTPNFSITGSNGAFNISRTGPLLNPQRQGLFDLLGTQLDTVKPGFGRFTDAVKQAFGAARADALGDIRDSFAKRRLSGSSFAANQVGSVQAEFANQENNALAQAGIQELVETAKILQRQNSILSNAAQEQLRELNIATSFVSKISRGLNELASLNAELEFKAAQGAGKSAGAFGDIFGSAAENFLGSNEFRDLFSNSPATGPGSTGFQTGIGQAGFNFGL